MATTPSVFKLPELAEIVIQYSVFHTDKNPKAAQVL